MPIGYLADKIETQGKHEQAENTDNWRNIVSKFKLSPTYHFDGSNQSLAEWIAKEIPGVQVTIETLQGQHGNDLYTAKVSIKSNFTLMTNSQVFQRLEAKIQKLCQAMH